MTTNQAIAIAFPFITTAIIWSAAVMIVKPWRRKKRPEGTTQEAIPEERLIQEFEVGTVFAGLESRGELATTDKTGRRVQVDTDRALEEVERIIRAVRAREAVAKP